MVVHKYRVCYNAEISACEEGGEWQRALALLGTVGCASVEMSTIRYNAASSAGADAQDALSLVAWFAGQLLALELVVVGADAPICDIPTRLICFSDDLDGMRKVPSNVPNPERLEQYMQLPLTSVPDPFGEFESFGHHNNAMLRRFLDTFGFEYEFISGKAYYESGAFDEILLRALER